MLPATSLETRDLRLLQALEREGSVTRAAKLLHISQSAVSHQLKNLEERLAVSLFERSGRGLRFTSAGVRLLAVAKDVLEPLSRIESELRRISKPSPAILRVTTQCYTAYHWLPRVLSEFRSLHPNVELRIMPDASIEPLEALSKGELDLALSIGRASGKSWLQKRLFQDELVVVVAPGHRLARRSMIEPEDLKGERFILYDVASSGRELVRKKLFPRGGTFSEVLRIPLTDAVTELVKAGLGISILAGWAVAPHVAKGELVRLRITRAGLKRDWHGIYRRGTALSAAIDDLLRLIRARGLP